MQFLDELKSAVLNEDFYGTDEVLQKVCLEENAFSYVEPLLKLMEENPRLDFGIPGPATHFMEKFYGKGYENLLLESVKRCPTNQTLWMINRIINDPKLADRDTYMSVLADVAARDDIAPEVKADAQHFLEFQNSK